MIIYKITNKLIGKTRSGKPVYDLPVETTKESPFKVIEHPKHKDFTNEDHYDAAKLHRLRKEKHEGNKDQREFTEEAKQRHHENKAYT